MIYILVSYVNLIISNVQAFPPNLRREIARGNPRGDPRIWVNNTTQQGTKRFVMNDKYCTKTLWFKTNS